VRPDLIPLYKNVCVVTVSESGNQFMLEVSPGQLLFERKCLSTRVK